MIIRTTYVPATDTEGSKIRVDDGVTVRHVPWRHDLSVNENHEYAVRRLCGGGFEGDEWYANGEYVGWAWMLSPLAMRALAKRLETVEKKYEALFEEVKQAMGE